jgi:hypothetical protein
MVTVVVVVAVVFSVLGRGNNARVPRCRCWIDRGAIYTRTVPAHGLSARARFPNKKHQLLNTHRCHKHEKMQPGADQQPLLAREYEVS